MTQMHPGHSGLFHRLAKRKPHQQAILKFRLQARRKHTIPLLVATLGALTLQPLPLAAVQIQGQVQSTQGQVIIGAIVTVTQVKEQRSESAYSDASGFFSINNTMTGELNLRVRAPYFADTNQTISAEPQPALTLTMQQQEDPAMLSASLSASAHAANLEFNDSDDAKAFRSQCHFCHQIGNDLTRRPRDEVEWQAVLDRMQSYGALINSQNEAGFKTTLFNGFDGEPVKAIQSHDASTELFQASYQEWRLGDANSYIHDIEAATDGKLYGVDMGNDLIYVIDTHTGARETIPLPASELPLGGMFAGAVAPLGTFNAKHGPHSIQEGPDGKMWTTNSLAAEIMSFDPKTKAFKIYPIGKDAIYPHTLRWDAEEQLWFTLALSNQIGRFDPKTEHFTLIDTPSHGFWRWLSDAMFPSILEVASWFPKSDLHLTLSHHKTSGEGYKVLNLPYGLDVNPVDGSIWYSKLYAGYIGRIDPITLTVKEIKTPLNGPRRLRFSKDGTLWIPSFEESALMKFNTTTEEFTLFELPTLAANEYETPYALAIHPTTQEVWITSNQSDRIFRFSPTENRFISYPSPTRVSFLRDIVFQQDGSVCSSNANLPASAIEGGLPQILCIYPDKNANTGGSLR